MCVSSRWARAASGRFPTTVARLRLTVNRTPPAWWPRSREPRDAQRRGASQAMARRPCGHLRPQGPGTLRADGGGLRARRRSLEAGPVCGRLQPRRRRKYARSRWCGSGKVNCSAHHRHRRDARSRTCTRSHLRGRRRERWPRHAALSSQCGRRDRRGRLGAHGKADVASGRHGEGQKRGVHRGARVESHRVQGLEWGARPGPRLPAHRRLWHLPVRLHERDGPSANLQRLPGGPGGGAQCGHSRGDVGRPRRGASHVDPGDGVAHRSSCG